jgi:hypothetical protein
MITSAWRFGSHRFARTGSFPRLHTTEMTVGLNEGLIIGMIVGVCAILAIVFSVVLFLRYRNRDLELDGSEKNVPSGIVGETLLESSTTFGEETLNPTLEGLCNPAVPIREEKRRELWDL